MTPIYWHVIGVCVSALCSEHSISFVSVLHCRHNKATRLFFPLCSRPKFFPKYAYSSLPSGLFPHHLALWRFYKMYIRSAKKHTKKQTHIVMTSIYAVHMKPFDTANFCCTLLAHAKQPFNQSKINRTLLVQP